MKKIIIYVFLFALVIFTFLIVYFVNNYFSERVKVYIENKGVVHTQDFIQKSIMENVINDIKISELYIINKDSNEQTKNIIINTSQVNKIFSSVNKTLNKDMNAISFEQLNIPLSSIFGETIFSSIGPDIKLRVIPSGKYKCDVISKATEYGINNSLFEIYILIDIKIESIVPLIRVNSDVQCKIPIVMQIIHGEVPRYYYNTDKLVPDVYDNNS